MKTTARFRAQVSAEVLRLLRCCQPEDAVLILDDARRAYRTFDEINAENAAKDAAKAAAELAQARSDAASRRAPPDDGNFG